MSHSDKPTPTEANSPVPESMWPTWLTDVVEGIRPALEEIDHAEKSLHEITPADFQYTHVFNSWFSELQQTAATEIQNSKGKRKTEIPPALFYAQLCRNAEMTRFIDQAIFSRSHGIQRQLTAAKTFLAAGDLINAFVMYRGVLELAAHFLGTYRVIESLQIPEKFEELNLLWSEVHTALLKRNNSMRIDWKDLLTELGEKLAQKSSQAISYTPTAEKVDLTSKGIMSELDRLNKKVPKTRKVYEVLCEFLHPNIGTMIGMVNFSDLRKDDTTKVPFIHGTLSTSPPSGFASDAAPLILAIFQQVAAVSTFFLKTRQDTLTSRETCLALTQKINRYLLTKNPHRQFAYAPCPCGSGAKIRFCCGAK